MSLQLRFRMLMLPLFLTLSACGESSEQGLADAGCTAPPTHDQFLGLGALPECLGQQSGVLMNVVLPTQMKAGEDYDQLGFVLNVGGEEMKATASIAQGAQASQSYLYLLASLPATGRIQSVTIQLLDGSMLVKQAVKADIALSRGAVTSVELRLNVD